MTFAFISYFCCYPIIQLKKTQVAVILEEHVSIIASLCQKNKAPLIVWKHNTAKSKFLSRKWNLLYQVSKGECDLLLWPATSALEQVLFQHLLEIITWEEKKNLIKISRISSFQDAIQKLIWSICFFLF